MRGFKIMERIKSFTVNHNNLLPGLYVSRVDYANKEPITTFDMRVTRPNVEPVMDTGGIHTIEHLFATYLRNDKEWASKLIYFGPMGCRTGFYLIFAGELTPQDIKGVISRAIDFTIDFEGDIPGATPVECGNCYDHNLFEAKVYARKYKDEVLADFGEHRTVYPE